MNVSYRWLRALAPELEDAPARVAERLAMVGAPVDALVALGDQLAGVVIARVERVQRHPNADRLTLCEVDAGQATRLQVVCGAPNVRAGAYYPFAPVGATLPGGLEIRAAKIRGVVSHGMLCSERELGLGRDHTGILELHGRFTPGEPFAEALELNDVRLLLDVTPNRPDLLSHYGVARELAPGGEAGLRLAGFPSLEDGSAGAPLAALDEQIRFVVAAREESTGGVRVVLDDARGCPRYLGAVIRDVSVGPPPEWLAARLRAVGLRPINNVVDATNYVLFELGQPLHAFDLDRLRGPAVVIRRARADERMRTLDGEERVLHEELLVIADAERACAVAGVMGGAESEVTSATRNVFLECALFEPKTIRRSARALGLSTDASYRFERGVDPEGMERATRRALALIVAVAGGRVESVAVDLHPQPRAAPVVGLRPARVSQVLGADFDEGGVTRYLEPLGFRAVGRVGDAVHFRVPGHRWYDVTREIDLIEEVARRHGYDQFADELRAFRPSVVPDDPMAQLEDRLRTLLVARGFLEARSASFASEGEGDVALLNALSQAEAWLRASIAKGLLHRLEHNFTRGARHVRLFEIGTVFQPSPAGQPPREATHLAAVFTGARLPPHWSEATAAFDVWDLKALLLELARVLGLGSAAVVPGSGDRARGAVAVVDELAFQLRDDRGQVGWGGRVAAEAVDAPAWADPIWALEVRLSPEMAVREPPVLRALPAFPAVERDLALVVRDDQAAAAIEAAIRAAAGRQLEYVAPFDLYRGPGISEGQRSIAYRLRFRAPDRTLTDREVDDVVARVVDRLREEFGVQLRA
ncbi:MAG: phenylalanine--tRNA ligase subunit beta [Gemmatimonadetes bacterium]|nr:phenylalanine--tRNA ligase subunit beta [Gemmatimonadota bacterium]